MQPTLPHSEERVIQCTQIISTGGIVIAVQFEPMIVHQSSCNIASNSNGNAGISYKGRQLQLDATSEMDVSRLVGVWCNG